MKINYHHERVEQYLQVENINTNIIYDIFFGNKYVVVDIVVKINNEVI
jgi:hypothetical protein